MIKDQDIIDLFNGRDGIPSVVTLADGRRYIVYNIAWGYDIDDEWAHITTNISPSPTEVHQVDFFFTKDVVQISDTKDNAIWRRP